MNEIFRLSSLTAKDLKKLIPLLAKTTYTASDFSNNSFHLIKLLYSLKIKHTCMFMKTIDTLYPGLSFHYILEARKNFNREHSLFLYRIAYHSFSQPEYSLFQAKRRKLINDLVFSVGEEIDCLSPILKEASNAISLIDSLSFFNQKDKKVFCNIILNTSFEKYFLQTSQLLTKSIVLPLDFQAE